MATRILPAVLFQWASVTRLQLDSEFRSCSLLFQPRDVRRHVASGLRPTFSNPRDETPSHERTWLCRARSDVQLITNNPESCWEVLPPNVRWARAYRAVITERTLSINSSAPEH